MNNLPSFYKNALSAWLNLRKERNISTKEDILNENLFCNDNIKMNNKTILFNHWINRGICKIKDVWNTQDNNWVNERNILTQLNVRQNWMTEYFCLKNAIPRHWKELLKNGADLLQTTKTNKVKITDSDQIQVGNKPVGKLNNKSILNVLQEKNAEPKCINYWNNKFGKQLPWTEAWQNLERVKFPNKLKMFQWRTMHNVINTNAKLQLMGKGNGVCKLCEKTREDQMHLFLACEKLTPVLTRVKNEISKIKQIEVTNELILLGYHKSLTHKENQLILKLIISYKWEIWKNRNSFIFEKKTLPDDVIFNKIQKNL